MICSVLMKRLSEEEIEMAISASATVAASKSKRAKSQRQLIGKAKSKQKHSSRLPTSKAAVSMKLPPFVVGRFHTK